MSTLNKTGITANVRSQVWSHYLYNGMTKPMYEMSYEQEGRFFQHCDRLRRLGFCVLSEPLAGEIEGWLAGIAKSVERLEQRLTETNRAYQTRGKSKAALYYLSSNDRFDPGFGIHLTYEQRQANAAYRAQLDRGVTKWHAAFGDAA